MSKLKVFKFNIVWVDSQGKIINRQGSQAKYFSQALSKKISLEMVAIPGGIFLMGAPKEEKESRETERPQHYVTIQPFFMGKYPVTQAQWQTVANLPKINRDLNPTPSHFPGDHRPVECVSWDDAVEFCHRLSQKTNKPYRLPSEAEWEYSCRSVSSEQLSVKSKLSPNLTNSPLLEENSANPPLFPLLGGVGVGWEGSNFFKGEAYPPFYFGETITTDLANYCGHYIYAEEPEGKYRRETTIVGSFPPNMFGLYDMCGNVWEYCADNWHIHYKGAPTDGNPWFHEKVGDYYSVRGGSFQAHPLVCRSAFRSYCFRNYVSNDGDSGFRVACDLNSK